MRTQHRRSTHLCRSVPQSMHFWLFLDSPSPPPTQLLPFSLQFCSVSQNRLTKPFRRNSGFRECVIKGKKTVSSPSFFDISKYFLKQQEPSSNHSNERKIKGWDNESSGKAYNGARSWDLMSYTSVLTTRQPLVCSALHSVSCYNK